MDDEIQKAIVDFFSSVEKLKTLGVFRSDKYLGDLGEYICTYFYDLELAESGREPGHDGTDADGRVQVKYHGSTTRTNINLGNPEEYENLLVVLGPHSKLRSENNSGEYLVYRMSAEDVRQYYNHNSNTYSCGSTAFLGAPNKTYTTNA